MKKIIIKLLLITTIIILSLLYYLLFIQEDKVAILTYHNVVNSVKDYYGVDINKVKFEQQMKWLHDNNFKTLTMDEFYDWKIGNLKIPRKSVMITFDDGWKDVYTNAIPILEKYDMKATIFNIYYFEQISTDTNNNIYMTMDDLEDIKNNHKNILLESHSYSLHNKEKALSNNYDIYNGDIQLVKEKYNKDSKYYAYPYGNKNDNYIKALKDNDYKLAFTFGPYSFAKKENNNYAIPRIGVFESTKDWKLKLKLYLRR